MANVMPAVVMGMKFVIMTTITIIIKGGQFDVC